MFSKCFNDAIVRLGGASWKRKMERGINGPTVAGKKESDSPGVFQSEETETYAAMKAFCVAKGKAWATTRAPRLSLPFRERYSNLRSLPSCLEGTVFGLHFPPFPMLGI